VIYECILLTIADAGEMRGLWSHRSSDRAQRPFRVKDGSREAVLETLNPGDLPVQPDLQKY
jgi:hypothetical protein